MQSLLDIFHPHTPSPTDEFKNELIKLHTLLQQSQQDLNIVQAQKQKLDLILENMPDGIIAVEGNRTTLFLNQNAKRLSGLGDEILGKPVDQVLQFKNKENTLTFLHFCPERENYSGIIFKRDNLKIVGKSEAHINLTTTQVEKPGLPTIFILTLHDVSQDAKLEEMKFDFVSLAAHELRTPLTSIKGYLSVLMQESKDTLKSEQLQLLESALRASEQLNSLIENLLSVSRIERGVLAVNLEPVDWTTFVKDQVSAFQDRAKEKEIILEFTLPSQNIPRIRVDKLRMMEVLSNLLSNAIKYTEAGGQIKVWAESKDGEVVTHVQDSGHGIPPEAQSQLFNKFFRVSGPLEGGTKGTGLGLYITKSLVEMHHGKIWVTSEVGKGSTFSFSLPI